MQRKILYALYPDEMRDYHGNFPTFFIERQHSIDMLVGLLRKFNLRTAELLNEVV